MTIDQIQDDVVEEFSAFDDWMDKYALLIEYDDGRVVFQAESDAVIVKGIVSLLIKVLSGHTPTEILDAHLYFIEQIGLTEHLSPTRSNGLLAMVKQMRLYAMVFKAQEEEQKQ